MLRWAEVKELARPDTTYCDYDGRRRPDLERVWATAHMLDARIEWLRLDKTNRGWHLIVRWRRKWQPAQIVALQAILGSDPAREALNLMRTLAKPAGRDEARFWNILYERKL
jgi:hypothetical protein